MNVTLKAIFASAVLCAVAPQTQVADATNYRIIERTKVPDGGFD